MRRFVLERTEDVSGVSGTGTVAEGVEFSDGKVALRWVTNHEHQSTVIWDSILSVDVIHGHDGRTQVRWVDEPVKDWKVGDPKVNGELMKQYPEIMALIKAEKKINAIKELRVVSGLSLKDAKEAVETVYQPTPVQPTVHTPRPGQCRNTVANGIVSERAEPDAPDLPHWLARKDRTVHGYGTDSKGERYEIVRYDIQSRFFQEWAYRRRTINLSEAVALTQHAHLGRPGGGAFDRKVMERMGL